MKKGLIITLVIIAIVVIGGYSFFKGTYNSMVSKEEGLTAAWAQVENQYQRRADLIPNLVNTVKGYADFEQETLTAVIEARSKASSVQVNAENLNPEQIANFQQAQDGLSSALGRLLVVVERYPELKANEQFMQLQVQLEGTENRISVERMRFNEAVQQYNSYIRQFPNSIIAGIANFDRKGYFEAREGADQAPVVQF
jgi:LemA protein